MILVLTCNTLAKLHVPDVGLPLLYWEFVKELIKFHSGEGMRQWGGVPRSTCATERPDRWRYWDDKGEGEVCLVFNL